MNSAILELERKSQELDQQRRERAISNGEAFDLLRGEVRKAVRNLPAQKRPGGARSFARFIG